MLSIFVQLSSLIYERAPNENKYTILYHALEKQREIDLVGKISLYSPEEKYFLKLKSEGRSVLKIYWAKEIPKVN